MAARKVKVEMQVTSWVHKRGQIVEVDKDTAADLIAKGYAISASDAAKKLEREILGTAPEPGE